MAPDRFNHHNVAARRARGRVRRRIRPAAICRAPSVPSPDGRQIRLLRRPPPRVAVAFAITTPAPPEHAAPCTPHPGIPVHAPTDSTTGTWGRPRARSRLVVAAILPVRPICAGPGAHPAAIVQRQPRSLRPRVETARVARVFRAVVRIPHGPALRHPPRALGLHPRHPLDQLPPPAVLQPKAPPGIPARARPKGPPAPRQPRPTRPQIRRWHLSQRES